jgi:hypothetical protein
MSYVGGPQFPLLLVLADKALRTVDPGVSYWALQRHHPDGRRWIEVGRFATEDIAELALDAFVAHGQGEREDFRVEHVRHEEVPT